MVKIGGLQFLEEKAYTVCPVVAFEEASDASKQREGAMKRLMDRFRADPSESTMERLIDRVTLGPVSDEDLAYLANTLGGSGETLSLPKASIADLASTGGPTSLSTLLCPLFLRAFGCTVPKLGVPGRPAGAVDVLAQIPGYQVDLTPQEVVTCIERCGYAHFLAGVHFAPLDARLFQFRRRLGKLNVPDLAIASLLAKKVAVGVLHAGLDVRVAPHGNFGVTTEEARESAARFLRVARLIGLKAVCFLTQARFPYQPYVGRGESLVALSDALSGAAAPPLRGHLAQCIAMAAMTTGVAAEDLELGMRQVEEHFEANLAAQGSSRDAFEDCATRVREGHGFEVTAQRAGFFSPRLGRLRDLIVSHQKCNEQASKRFPDGMGVILKRDAGDFVGRGDIVATVRVAQRWWHDVSNALKGILEITSSPEVPRDLERVENG